jgi:hypothetical protein
MCAEDKVHKHDCRHRKGKIKSQRSNAFLPIPIRTLTVREVFNNVIAAYVRIAFMLSCF